ncbi:uncharacterized protein spt4 isoform X1 [Eurosta solidaginis]|uniref:uncharacterized protein spt4 isoform X1 n=1 Tax=Eurosta solidaginis TaxID=178769 RepID=UPI003530F26F
MRQMVNFNTRIAERSQTRIDLLYVNADVLSCINLENHRISDHETISFAFKVCNSNPLRRMIPTMCWKNYSADNLIYLLRNYDFSVLKNMHLNDSVEYINTCLSHCMGLLTSEQDRIVRLRNKWYDHELTEINKLKIQLHSQARRSGEFSEYNTVAKYYKKLIKIKKIKYMEKNIALNSSDRKLMWKHLKQAVNLTEVRDNILTVIVNGIRYETPEDIAQALNSFFVDSIGDINREIETLDSGDSVQYTVSTCLKFQEVTVDDVILVAKRLKNKIGGTNLLSEGVIKDSVSYMGHFYADIINKSLVEGIVPDAWKISTIVPIKKVVSPVVSTLFRYREIYLKRRCVK